MADISLRRNLTASAALSLLLVPGCQLMSTDTPYTEAIGFASEDLPDLPTHTVSVDTEHSTVGYRYPVLGESHPLSIRVRTEMAQRQTAFLEDLPERGKPELTQDTELLAASTDVVGLRMNVHDSTTEQDESTTLWYDAHTEQVLPWTSLFKDEQALTQIHLDLANELRQHHDLTTEELPGLLGQIASQAEATQEEEEAAVSAPSPSPTQGSDASQDTKDTNASQSTDLNEAEQAWKDTQDWADSPLADLAFSTAGGLAVRMDPDHLPGSGRLEEVLVPIEPELTEPTLSELGYQARDAAISGNASADTVIVDPHEIDPGNTLNCAHLKCVALTFDDGPGEHTDQLLDHLADYDAKATFYILGSLVGEFPQVVERTATEGHEIANHTWDHADLTGLSADEVRKDLERTDQAIEEVTGQAPVTMRPPYGALNDTVRGATPHPLILWDVDTMDWQSRDTKAITTHALDETQPGSVVLFHDIHKTSVNAIPEVLDQLHRQGYHFVTVKELFGLEGLPAGEVLTDARIN